MKKVSIIIPCHNQADFVEEALQSALNQTYKNIEIICVNDGSSDNSAEIIKTFSDKYKNIVFFDEKENRGVIYSRNMAINAAKGDYVLPLDADDKIETTFVEKAVQILEKSPDIGIVYSKANFFGYKNEEWKLPDFSPSEILFANQIFGCAMFRKADFFKAGCYKDYMKLGCEDWDLWLSFLELGLKVHRIDETLFYYRKLEKQKTRTDFAITHSEEINAQIFKNHLKLYVDNKLLLKKVFQPSYEKKFKKYKKMFKLFFTFSLIELLLLLAIASLIILNGGSLLK